MCENSHSESLVEALCGQTLFSFIPSLQNFGFSTENFFNMRLSALLAGLAALSGALAGKKRLIIDTDMLNFDDDPLAIGLANILENWGEVELIGVMSSI